MSSLLTTLLLLDAREGVFKASDGDAHWVTIEGQHVLIGGKGQVLSGNPKVVGGKTTLKPKPGKGKEPAAKPKPEPKPEPEAEAPKPRFAGDPQDIKGLAQRVTRELQNELEGKEVSGKPEFDKFTQLLKEQNAQLTPTQVTAARYYTGDDGDRDFNQYLRGEKSSLKDEKAFHELQAAVTKHELPEGTALFRGATLGPSEIKSLKPGATFSDKAFLSTSTDPKVAAMFGSGMMHEDARGTPVVFQYVTEKGQKGLAVPHNRDEREVILPPGSKFKVIEAKSLKSEAYEGLVVRIRRAA